MLAKPQHRRMFNLSRYNVTLAGLCLEHAPNRRIVSLGTATREDHLDGVGGADQCGNLCPSIANFLPNLATKAMNARWITVMFRQERQHRRCHFWQDWCGRVIIEVNFASHNVLSI